MENTRTGLLIVREICSQMSSKGMGSWRVAMTVRYSTIVGSLNHRVIASMSSIGSALFHLSKECGRNTNGASVSGAYTKSNVTTSVKWVSGRGNPTYMTVAMVTTLSEPASRKRAIRSGGMPVVLRRSPKVARLNVGGREDLNREDKLPVILPIS